MIVLLSDRLGGNTDCSSRVCAAKRHGRAGVPVQPAWGDPVLGELVEEQLPVLPVHTAQQTTQSSVQRTRRSS